MQGDRYSEDDESESITEKVFAALHDYDVSKCGLEEYAQAGEDYTVDGFIPQTSITQLSGNGGVGKSTLAVALGVAFLKGLPWCGLPVNFGERPVLYVTGEEDSYNIDGKISNLLYSPTSPYAFEGLTWADMQGFKILDLTKSPIGTHLMDSNLKTTPNWLVVKKRVKAHKPGLVIFDSQVDMYGANENDRAQVRAFVSMLRGLNTTVVVLAHPSRGGLETGSGESGSTGWRAAYRSNLYATKRGDLVRVTNKKTNYAQPGKFFDVVWRDGFFVPAVAATQPVEAVEAPTGPDATAEFLDRLKAFKPPLTDKPRAPNYAPRVFAKESDRFNVADFARAMANLLKAGTIGSREYQDAHRNKRKRLVVV